MQNFVVKSLVFFLGFMACQKLTVESEEPSPSFIRGITLADWTQNGYGANSVEGSLKSIKAAGATHLAIVITGYQLKRTSNEIRISSSRTPSPSAVRHALNLAKILGLKLVLKIHIESDDATWSKAINPTDPAAWFEFFHNFILPWAVMSESIGAVQFVIGTELGGTIQYKKLWQQAIHNVRSVFSGELVYAASWDEVFKVPFWQDLDFVGVDFYFPVTNRKDPGRLEILAGWQPWLQRLELLHKQTGLNILLTEIGYRSIDGAGMKPHQFDNHGSLDLSEQADLYWAALQATAETNWLAGMYWWNWIAEGTGGIYNTDYTPSGKPAELELTYSHANSFDLFDLQGNLSWQHVLGKSSVYPYVAIGGGVMQEWLGSFQQVRYPFGFNLGFRTLVTQSVAIRVEYKVRKVLHDPVSNFVKHHFVFGISLLFKNSNKTERK